MFTIPSVLGYPINIWEGIILLFLLTFQLFVGLRVIKIDFKWHKWNGILIFTIALVHAFLGLSVWVFHIATY